MQESFIQRLTRPGNMQGSLRVDQPLPLPTTQCPGGGFAPSSSHLKGLAVDIAVGGGSMRYAIRQALMQAGFDRFGLGPDFIHVDADTDKPQQVEWLYQ